MIYEVRKAIPGTAHLPGDLVDGQGWRTINQLVQQRYLIPRYETAPAEILAMVAENTPAEINADNTLPVRRGRGR